MAGNGGMARNNEGNGATQGTEYTLQGVMTFLQTEWHRHERERNIWEIERAEMKARIARLEGDVRTSKRMHESLGKHVRILEVALKREREKNRLLVAGEKAEGIESDPRELAKDNIRAASSAYATPQSNQFDNEAHDLCREAEREKSRLYLSKCANEVSYHIIPGSYPPPDLDILQDSPQNSYPAQHSQQQPSYSENWVTRQKGQQIRLREPEETEQQRYRQQASPAQSQQHPSQAQSKYMRLKLDRGDSWSSDDSQFRGAPMTREVSVPDRKAYEMQQRQLKELQQQQQQQQQPRRAQGSAIPVQQKAPELPYQSQDTGARTQRFGQELPSEKTGMDEWNFDDPSVPEQGSGPMHRPDVDAFPSANLASVNSSGKDNVTDAQGNEKVAENDQQSKQTAENAAAVAPPASDNTQFNVRFALRGHLDVVRCAIFTGGGSPSEPEICTCGDDGTIKRWVIPATYGAAPQNDSPDLDVTSYFTHRGHDGAVTSLAACPPSQNFSSGGRALGDGWIFSGGQDGTVRVWERGRVDAKACLEGHTDAVWSVCVLPGTSGSVFGERSSDYGGTDKILLASAAADGTVRIWAISAPPQINSPQQSGGRGRAGGRRSNSISSGSNFPSSPQPSTATQTPFHYCLIHTITRPAEANPTCVAPFSPSGATFVVSYNDSSVVIYDTKTGEQVREMTKSDTYDGTPATGASSVVALVAGAAEGSSNEPSRELLGNGDVAAAEDNAATRDTIICGYEDRYIRLFDANNGQCIYSMLAHPASVSSVSVAPCGNEFVSGGHDSGLRFWSLGKRSCIQELTSHRPMRGEGVCSVVWSQDGRWVVSGGGDGVVKIFSR